MQWIEHNLVWLALVVLALIAVVTAFRWELPRLAWRELMMKLGAPRGGAEIAPPPEHGQRGRMPPPHEALPHKPAFHRSGRRSGH
jgi:hypothetical protein